MIAGGRRTGEGALLASVGAAALGFVSCTTVLGLDGIEYRDPEDPTTASTAASVDATTVGEGGATSSGSTASTSSHGGGGGGVGGAGSGGDGGSGGAGGAGGACTPDALAASDEFEESPLDPKWSELDDAEGWLGSSVSDGSLVLPAGPSQWYADGSAPFVYQDVSGDFVAWTHAVSTVDGDAAPTASAHGGGILLRAAKSPPGGAETFIIVSSMFLEANCGVTAYVNDAGSEAQHAPDFETFSCDNELALCRIGGVTQVFARENDADDWTELELGEFGALEPLDGDAQLGLASHAFAGGEALQASFGFFRLSRPCDVTCAEAVEALGR